MTSKVLIKIGEYRNNPVIDTEFFLVRGPQDGKKGRYITVKNNDIFPVEVENIRIKVTDDSNYEIINPLPEESVVETDVEAMDRIATRFKILDQMSEACISGKIKSLIVSGPPGVGKSHGVETQLEKSSLFDRITGDKIRYNVVKGALTAIGLYVQLYQYSDKGNVLVFDDADCIFFDDLSLNILKAALDSGKRRKICWNSDSRLLREEGIPNSFYFKGSVIFITNLKFANVKSKKLQDHLDALESRSHFLDLTINSERDKLLRIRQVHRDSRNGLFNDYGFQCNEPEEIFSFMEENQSKLRELSIRMALKIADLFAISPTEWKSLAESTCMKRG